MQRRKFFVKAGGALAAAAAAPVVDAPYVIAQPRFQWRMPTMWPPANDILLGNAQRFGKMVDELTGGRLKIQVFAGGELMPATGVFDACAQGTVEAFNGGAYYWAGKESAFQWFTSVPFGMNAQGYFAWFHFGDGLKLWEEAYAPFGVVPRPAQSTNPQMTGWFRKKINTIDDLKGLKIRIPGLGGKVYAKAGSAVVLLPPGEIYTALERGTLDATEFIGPHDDLKLGFQNAARYYYYPGWHEPTSIAEFSFNKKAYDALPAEFRHALNYAADAIYGLLRRGVLHEERGGHAETDHRVQEQGGAHQAARCRHRRGAEALRPGDAGRGGQEPARQEGGGLLRQIHGADRRLGQSRGRLLQHPELAASAGALRRTALSLPPPRAPPWIVLRHAPCGRQRAYRAPAGARTLPASTKERSMRELARRIDAWQERFGRAVSWLSLLMILVVFGDVLMRYLFRTTYVAAQEFEWYLFGTLYLLAAGYTLLHDEHVRVDIVYSKLSPREGPAQLRALLDLLLSLLPAGHLHRVALRPELLGRMGRVAGPGRDPRALGAQVHDHRGLRPAPPPGDLRDRQGLLPVRAAGKPPTRRRRRSTDRWSCPSTRFWRRSCSSA